MNKRETPEKGKHEETVPEIRKGRELLAYEALGGVNAVVGLWGDSVVHLRG
jgi:hypothetical protein